VGGGFVVGEQEKAPGVTASSVLLGVVEAIGASDPEVARAGVKERGV